MRQIILKIFLLFTTLFLLQTMCSTKSFAACTSPCIDSGSPCGAPGTYCLDGSWSACLPECVEQCYCAASGSNGWCTCSSCTPGSCGGCTPTCPDGYSGTYQGCAGTTTATCTGSDGCDPCTVTIPCYKNQVYTSAPATPTAVYILRSTTESNLSTSSSSPTAINFSLGGSVSTYSNVNASAANGGYWYNAYNAYTGGTLTLNYEGTTRSQTLSYSNQGRVEAKHYRYQCESYTGTKYTSAARTGYYCNDSCSGSCTPTCPAGQSTTVTGPNCLTTTYSSCSYSNSCNNSCNVSGNVCYYDEPNSPPASPPASVKITVGTVTYTLSTNPSTPTKIKFPETGESVSVQVPSVAGMDGYKFEVDNYGLDEWIGGTLCSGIAGEDFCKTGASNVQSFEPSSKTVAEVLRERTKGKITGYQYTIDDCDSETHYSAATVGYYIVKPIPTTSFYQIQVNTNSSFTGVTLWDSTKTQMSTIYDLERSEDLIYNGAELIAGVTYYWRIKFWDSEDQESPWSAVAQFTMKSATNSPTYMLVEGEKNPRKIYDFTPEFSFVFRDPDTTDTGTYYQIQVNTEEDFSGTSMWDSTQTAHSPAIVNNGRSLNIPYAGTALTNDGTQYYWRVKVWDNNGADGPWSEVGTFRTTAAPGAPTATLTDRKNNPNQIASLTPSFSAVHNDVNGDSATAYEIEVNTSSLFTGTVMWDTGKISTSIAEGGRSPDYTYAGTTLTNSNTTYYWRIRFWDEDDNVSAWSTTSSFRSVINSVSFNLLKMQGLKVN